MVEPVAPTTESTRPSHQPPANERTSSLYHAHGRGHGAEVRHDERDAYARRGGRQGEGSCALRKAPSRADGANEEERRHYPKRQLRRRRRRRGGVGGGGCSGGSADSSGGGGGGRSSLSAVECSAAGLHAAAARLHAAAARREQGGLGARRAAAPPDRFGEGSEGMRREC